MAVWRQLHQAVRKFCSCEMRCKTHLWHASAISQPMPPSSQLWTTWEITSKLKMKLRIISKLQNHLQVVKSPLSCKTKVQTSKMDNSTCESPCEIHLCKLRYLQPTSLDFFLKILIPYNQSKILLGYFLENIFSIYIFEPM